MKVAIIGAGAVGSVIGGLLSGDYLVTLVGRKEHVHEVTKNGLIIEGENAGTYWPVATTSTKKLPVQDAVIITVKAYDLEQAVKDSLRLIGPSTTVVIVQNGLWVLKGPLRASFARPVIAVASLGATLLGPGRVRLTGKGWFEVGSLEGRLSRATLAAQLLRSAGFEVKVTDDIVASVWRKALINAAINPVTALLMEPNGSILENPDHLALSKALFNEGLDVAVCLNVLTKKMVSFEDVIDVIRSTARNRSSMLQDLENKRRTEIDAINGAICDLAPRPEMVRINSRMVKIVKALETWE
ncbi:MAG: 2-dehydropantoate 2-reductase [Methanomassiliicoccales archaeon]|nr:MAG: 2-dehydropantoate 2-reductase [Methanomassiliicoccales archaeon]